MACQMPGRNCQSLQHAQTMLLVNLLDQCSHARSRLLAVLSALSEYTRAAETDAAPERHQAAITGGVLERERSKADTKGRSLGLWLDQLATTSNITNDGRAVMETVARQHLLKVLRNPNSVPTRQRKRKRIFTACVQGLCRCMASSAAAAAGLHRSWVSCRTMRAQR